MRLAQVRNLQLHRNKLAIVLLLTVATLTSGVLWARPTEPSRTDRQIALLVSALMDHRHLSDTNLNDEISERAFDKFIKHFDKMKLFFLQSDIEEFGAERKMLDDYVKAGDTSFAQRVYNRFIDRVEERVEVAVGLLDVEHDFSMDETMVREPEKTSFAASKEELDERWRKRVKYDLLIEIADEVEHEEAVEKLSKRYRGIHRGWQQTDNDELLEAFLSAIASSFDPHSSYMSPSTLENFTIQMRLELNGIGASLESRHGETIVRKIVPGGAADKDGRLKIGDIIVAVAEGKDGEMVDIVDMKINNVVQLIRGKPDSIVRLEVIPADQSGRTILDITRARIELKDSEARSAILERPSAKKEKAEEDSKVAEIENETTNDSDEGPKGKIVEQQREGNGPPYRIGVIGLPSFYMDMDGRRSGKVDYKSTTSDLRRLLQEFERQNVDLVVMDLRFNGGGSLPESVETTGLFIDQGPVVQVKGPDGRIQPFNDDSASMAWSGPLVVLVNRFSASASEIFAGAIQDYGRGIVVGDKSTHGKGTVQQLEDLGQRISSLNPPNYGALKLTIQQFYRPSGDSTQSRGVVSDIELPYRTSYWEGIGEADLDYALEFDRVAPLPHNNYRSASANILQELGRRSAERVENSKFFKEEQKKIERIIERQKEATVTLNKEKFLAEREEINAEKDQQDLIDSLEDDDRPVFPSTPYNEEVLAIALDYLELLGDDRIAVAR